MIRPIVLCGVLSLRLMAQSPADLSLQVLMQADGGKALSLRNGTKKRLIAYSVAYQEALRSKTGTTIRSSGGVMGDVTIDPFVTAIAPGESTIVFRRGVKAEQDGDAQVDYRVNAVLYEDGSAAGEERWVIELRERRALTFAIAKAVLEEVRAVNDGRLRYEEGRERLQRFGEKLRASTLSSGGRRLCEAFVGDTIASLDSAESSRGENEPTIQRERILKGLARAQEIRLERFRAWGIE